MTFISTRGGGGSVALSDCILSGLAKDGGLYVPTELPKYELSRFHMGSFAEFAVQFLRPFFKDDFLEKELGALASRAFNFPIHLHRARDQVSFLELFHGPTNAFKDFGARFLAECFEKILNKECKPKETLVLVATSGDTGSAVASAFCDKENIKVGLLFPQGGVSERQKQQLTGWGRNILSFEVEGTFDNCQSIVKRAFEDDQLNEKYQLTSANSINIARLLPQASYFAFSSLNYCRVLNQKPSFFVPTGNMGNVYGAYLARACGFPIDKIIIATNANRTIADFFEHDKFEPRASIKTLANAMDVGAPSNMERLLSLHKEKDYLKTFSKAFSVEDDEIRRSIRDAYENLGEVICPHTATAYYSWCQEKSENAIIVATAHPAKFNDIVDPVIGIQVETPRALQAFLSRKPDHVTVKPELDEIKNFLL